MSQSIFRQSHILATASRYARPKDGNAILPYVYGVHYGDGKGRWICPCIDTSNFYYLLADHAILSVANGNVIKVFVDDVLQTSGYSIITSGTDENGKVISYIDFASNPGDNVVVTAQGYGKINNSGAMLNHPMDIIADIVTYAGGSTADFDAMSWQEEYLYASSMQFYAAGILTHGSRLVQELILEILASFQASSWVAPSGKLKFQFPRVAIDQNKIALYLREGECSDFQATRQRENLCNVATWDCVHAPASNNAARFVNITAANVDNYPAVGSVGSVVFSTPSCVLSWDSGTTTCHAWYLALDRTSIIYQIYGGGGGWVPREFTQLSDGSRKRLLWSNASTGQASLWLLDAAFAYVSNVLFNGGAIPYGYWHDGSTGRLIWCDASGNGYIWTLDGADAYVSSQTYATYSGWTLLSYSNGNGGRRRLLWRNDSDGSLSLHTLSASDVYVSNQLFPAMSGQTPQHYWHDGQQGRITYTGSPGVIKHVDINDALTDYALMNTQADVNDAAKSLSQYGTFTKQFDGGWMQDVTTPLNLQRAIFARYAQPRWLVQVTTTDVRVLQQIERGDLIGFSWKKLLDENGLPLINQIGQVLEITRNVLEGTSTLKLRDTGAYYTGSGTTRDRNRY